MSPTNRHKCKNLHSTVQRAKDRRQKFHFCRLPFDVRPRNVKLLISLIAHGSRGVARLLECHILWWILMVNVLTSRKSISNSSGQTLFSGEPVTAGNTSAFTFHLKMQILLTFRKTYKYNYSKLYLNILPGITEMYHGLFNCTWPSFGHFRLCLSWSVSMCRSFSPFRR